MTTVDYLTSLQNDKATLVTNLTAKGISGLTGDETFTELVPEVLNIPSGSSISGTTINAEIQEGTINKGDFVKRGDYTIADTFNSSNNYNLLTNTSITNEANMWDGNSNTYATISSSAQNGNPRIYIQCKSRSQLNIPASALIKNVVCNYKVGWETLGTSYTKYVASVKYTDGDISQTQSGVGIGYTKNYSSITAEGIEDNVSFIYFNANSNTNEYGFQAVSGSNINNKIRVYFANFDIYYEYEGKTKKITDNGDIILGIANENGSQGDTIEVIVPSVE